MLPSFSAKKSTKNTRNTKLKKSHNLSLVGTTLVIHAHLILYYDHNQVGMQATRGGETLFWWHMSARLKMQEWRLLSPSLVAVPSAWVCPSFSLPQPFPFCLHFSSPCCKKPDLKRQQFLHSYMCFGMLFLQSAHFQGFLCDSNHRWNP